MEYNRPGLFPSGFGKAQMGNVIHVSELLKLSAFRAMPEMQLEQLATVLVRQTYAPRQIIFVESEPSFGLWFVAEGRVKIIKQSQNGRVQSICLMKRGKCFGSCPLFSTGRNPATAQALDHVTLFILPQEQLQHLGKADSCFVAALLHVYSQRLESLARLSTSLSTWTVADRINDALLTYADRTESRLVVVLTHEELAALSGTVREVVTRHLARLEKAGTVRIEPGQITLWTLAR